MLKKEKKKYFGNLDLRGQGGSGTFLGVFFVLKYVIVLSETISTLFTEFKNIVVVSSSVRRRFRKYRGIHTIREFKSQFAETH